MIQRIIKYIILILSLHYSISWCQIAPNPNGNRNLSIEEQNRETMRRLGYSPPPTQAEIRSKQEQDRKSRSKPISKKEQHRHYVYSLLREESRSQNSSNKKGYAGSFPYINYTSQSYQQGITYFEKAYSEISNMLDSAQDIDLKKAIFLMENTVIRGEISYQGFTKKIQQLTAFLKQIAEEENINLENDLGAHFAIQKLFSDTIYNKRTNEFFYPFTYDLNDIYGSSDPKQTLVSKLLYTGKGQCKSMPLLYSILAQELNTESYIAFSPNHSYIKFKDQKGTWFNFETTNGMNTTDSWVMGSGFIKVEAIKSRIYTEPITKKQILAHLLVELAIEYQEQFGYDSRYMNKLLNKALQHFPNDIFAHMLKANLKTAECDRALWKIGYPPIKKLHQYPKQEQLFKEMMTLCGRLDDLGYSKMPKSAYDEWLASLEQEKNKQNGKRIQLLIRTNAR